MSTNTGATTNTTTSLAEERINILIKELSRKRRSTNWGTNLSLLIGLAAIVLLGGYFGYGYYMFDDVTKPENIVKYANSYLDEYSAQAREVAAEEVRKSAPIWAKEVSRELVAKMPMLREKAETTIVSYLDEQLEKTQQQTGTGFSELMDQNRGSFADAIDIIVKEGSSDEFVEKVMPIIEENYAPEMKSSVLNALGTLQDINRRMEKLARGQNLNEIEEQQRHILGLTRMLRQQ
jgi:hypothetical protein